MTDDERRARFAGNTAHSGGADIHCPRSFRESAIDLSNTGRYFLAMLNPLNSFRILLVKALKKVLGGVKFRGKGTLLSMLCPRDREIEIEVAGYRFRCNLAEHIQRTIFLWGHDQDAFAFIRSRIRPGATFVDVGANVGIFSLMASQIVGPTGRVISVEPNPATFARLSRTVAENSISNITLCNVGLADISSKLELFTGTSEGNDTASMLPGVSTISVTVDVLPLDRLVEQLGVERIDYMKIDVDGFEHKVLSGAEKLMAAGKIRHMQCEFSDIHLRIVGSSPEKLHDAITSHGFRDVNGTPSFFKDCVVDRFFEFAPAASGSQRD